MERWRAGKERKRFPKRKPRDRKVHQSEVTVERIKMDKGKEIILAKLSK